MTSLGNLTATTIPLRDNGDTAVQVVFGSGCSTSPISCSVLYPLRHTGKGAFDVMLVMTEDGLGICVLFLCSKDWYCTTVVLQLQETTVQDHRRR
jgi:hypothetical protein